MAGHDAMNWDEKAKKHADGTKPEADWELELIGDDTWEVATIDGAKWQRDQLRTDEAIERVARGIHDHECSCGDLANEEYGEAGVEYFRAKARVAINALIGTGDSND